jgi:molybdate transport system ATP-binding protein
MLDVNVSVLRGEFLVEARFQAPQGITALFGPSGSGKTTILSMIAGVLRPDRGHITIDGRMLFNATTGAYVPTEHRRIGYVFQDRRLFPHMSVEANLYYGFNLVAPSERSQKPTDIIAMLDLGALLARRPLSLSGGEQQRVAIGRALLMSPRALLMDEPLASLDASRKAEILPYLERLRDSVRLPILYVSHDEREVARLAKRTIMVVDGQALGDKPSVA